MNLLSKARSQLSLTSRQNGVRKFDKFCKTEWDYTLTLTRLTFSPCKILGPVLEKEVDALNGKVTLVKIDSDENPGLARSLRVSSLPTVFGVFEGQQVDMFVGYSGPQKVKEFVSKMSQLKSDKK